MRWVDFNDFREESFLCHEHAVGDVRLSILNLSFWVAKTVEHVVLSMLSIYIYIIYNIIVAPSLAAENNFGFMVPSNLWTMPMYSNAILSMVYIYGLALVAGHDYP